MLRLDEREKSFITKVEQSTRLRVLMIMESVKEMLEVSAYTISDGIRQPVCMRAVPSGVLLLTCFT